MAITVKNLSEMFGKDVFTTKGEFCGRVIDIQVSLGKYRIKSIVVEAGRNTFLSSMVGGRKGVIVPYGFVNSIGDVVLVKHFTSSSVPEEPETVESVGLETF